MQGSESTQRKEWRDMDAPYREPIAAKMLPRAFAGVAAT